MKTTRKAFLSAIASAAFLLCAAQAQAQNFTFSQAFNDAGVVGTVSGTFTAVDTNLNTRFDFSEMTFQTMTYSGTVPTLGSVNLSFAPPDIVANPSVTLWYATDQNLGALANGFFLSGTSATGTQMVWVAGPANVFGVGDLGGPNGDPQNAGINFGQVSFFTGINAGEDRLGVSNSQTYANIVPTPIPEPATYLMMLGGIAALVARARRRAA